MIAVLTLKILTACIKLYIYLTLNTASLDLQFRNKQNILKRKRHTNAQIKPSENDQVAQFYYNFAKQTDKTISFYEILSVEIFYFMK